MDPIIVEVISLHYIGQLFIELDKKNDRLFYVSTPKGFLGRVIYFVKGENTQWYSPEITDKELLDQIGEWIEHYTKK